MLTTMAALACASLASVAYATVSTRARVIQDRATTAGLVGTRILPALETGDSASVNRVLAALEFDPSVLAATVFDARGAIVASWFRTPDTPSQGLSEDQEAWFRWDPQEVFHPLTLDEEPIGTVYIRSVPAAFFSEVRGQAIAAGFTALGGLLLALVLMSRLRRVVAEPILDVARTARLVLDADDFTVRASRVGNDEVGQLTDAFNKILDRVEVHERELNNARDAANAANRAKTSFLVTMSHELRTPLNGIIGYSEMLSEEAADRGRDDLIPDLEMIRHAAGDLLGLISNVLDLSKIETGRIDLIIEEFNLHALLDRVVDGIRPIAAVNSNQIFVDIGPDLAKFSMKGDSTKVAQCVRNLLANSCKFTDHGSIQLFVRRRADQIYFRVSDTGIGMDKAQLEHVFEEFFQVEITLGRQFGGSGLGLAICRRLCRRMGGDVTAKSRSGKGSTFEMHLPVQCPDGAAESTADAVPLAS